MYYLVIEMFTAWISIPVHFNHPCHLIEFDENSGVESITLMIPSLPSSTSWTKKTGFRPMFRSKQGPSQKTSKFRCVKYTFAMWTSDNQQSSYFWCKNSLTVKCWIWRFLCYSSTRRDPDKLEWGILELWNHQDLSSSLSGGFVSIEISSTSSQRPNMEEPG